MSKPTSKEYKKFITLLEKWDYYYYNTDNNSLYVKGRLQEANLRSMANSNQYLQDIFKQFHFVQDTKGTAEYRNAIKKLEELKTTAIS